MKIQILRTFRESFKDVWAHTLPWFRTAFAPMIVFLGGIFGLLLTLFLSITAGGGSGIVLNKETLAAHPGTSALFIGAAILIYLIPLYILYINGYRYAAFGEGGDRWWTFQLNTRFLKMFLYTLLVGLLWGIYISFAAGIVFGANYLLHSVALNVILGILLGLYGFYIVFRLGLIFFLIGIDKPEPIRASWYLLKGNVLRLVGLMLLIGIFFSLISSGISFILGLFADPNNASAIISVSILNFVFHLLVWFFNWAVFSKATALIYKDLS